jgi:Coenzyme PQQ synthesis protein D (PqqD)
MLSVQPKIVDGLDLNELDDGMVVFSESTDTVHHLNHTAAVVLQFCDGTHDADAIAGFVAAAFGLADPPVGATKDCLEALNRQGLVS